MPSAPLSAQARARSRANVACRPTGWEEKSAASGSRFFSQPSQGHSSLLANGDVPRWVGVPAPDPWVCSDRAFRRALRWLLREVRAAALWSMIWAQLRLIVSTCHDSVGDGFVPCEFGSPGPRAHCIPMDRAPGPSPTAVRPRLPANAKFPRLGWDKESRPRRRALLFPPSGPTPHVCP